MDEGRNFIFYKKIKSVFIENKKTFIFLFLLSSFHFHPPSISSSSLILPPLTF